MAERALTIPAQGAGPARLAYVADGLADTAWSIEEETRPEHREQHERNYRAARAGYAECELALLQPFIDAWLDLKRAQGEERRLLERHGASRDLTDRNVLATRLADIRWRIDAARERVRSAKARIINQGLPGDDGASAARFRARHMLAAG